MPSIFAQYLKPPKSMLEYGAELDAAEANRLSLAEARRKGAAADESAREENAFKAALRGGLDLEEEGGLQRGLGIAPKSALGAYKSLQEGRKARETAAKEKKHADLYSAQEIEKKLDTRIKEINDFKNNLRGLATPDQVVSAIDSKVAEGKLTRQEALAITARMDTTSPQGFRKWLDGVGLSAEQEIAKLNATKLHFSTLIAGKNLVTTAANPHTGDIVKQSQTAITPTDLQRAQTDLAKSIAGGHAPAGTNVDIGGGMSVPATAAAPPSVAPPSISPPAAAPRAGVAAIDPSVQAQRNREQIALLERELAQPVNSNPRDQQAIREQIARLSGGQPFPTPGADPARLGTIPQTTPVVPERPPVAPQQSVFVEEPFVAPAPNPGETRNQYTARIAGLERTHKAGQLALRRDFERRRNAAPSAAVQKEALSQTKEAKQVDVAIRELEELVKPGSLLDKATGSFIGAGVDLAGRAVGKTPKGAEAIGKLAPIAHMVLMLVPRFEGPQGVLDVKIYEKAAGNLADPTTTPTVKKAAAKEILRLMKERKGQFTLKDTPLNRAPEVSLPDGVDEATWGAMTPEERALWQR